MLDCYHHISNDKAFDVLKKIKAQTLNPKDYEFKNLIDLDKWGDLFQSNDESRLNEELSDLKYSMEELRSIV